MALSPEGQQQLQTELDRLGGQLDAGQLTWASGYFAGLAAAGSPVVASEPAPAAQAETASTLTVWYGTETGNACGVAERLAAAAREQGCAVDVASLAEVQPRRIAKLSLLVLVIATHGEGDPPEDAEGFYKLLTSDRAPRLDDLQFAVFALGDSSYPDFCQTGRDLDEALERLGATRVLDRVDCDVDFEPEEDRWRPRILERVHPHVAPENAAQPRLQVVRAGGGSGAALTRTPQWNRRNPFSAELLEVARLTVAPSNKSVHHVALSLEGSGLAYEPGDSLGIWPANDSRLVDEILDITGVNGDDRVEIDGEQLAVAEWLAKRRELTLVARPFVERYAELGEIGPLQELLEDRDRFGEWCRQHQVVDILHQYPVGLEAGQLVGSLRGIAPRLYSIASSPLVDSDEAHLTVKLEGNECDDGRLRAGAASWQLTRALGPGARLPVYVESNPRFRLPDDGDRPVVMIGPGTGVAPFRAFVEHRRALGHAGRTWLFFGEQHRRTDFLYQLEWQRHLRQGSLTRLTVAFSRDQRDKLYVQHRLREHGRALYEWLEDGAAVYVCGSGQAMAGDVHQALADVIADHRDCAPGAAEQYLARMKSGQRYQKDVY